MWAAVGREGKAKAVGVEVIERQIYVDIGVGSRDIGRYE